MARAIWKDTILAESDAIQLVEGNVYFPPGSVKREYFTESQTQSTCPWKGQARYYHINVNDEKNPDAAWTYPEPKKAASHIKGHFAFWKGVKVEK
jgi:uncharacterized protein (DUF427 family)